MAHSLNGCPRKIRELRDPDRRRTEYLGGQGDLVSRLIREITGVTIWVIGVINLLTKSP